MADYELDLSELDSEAAEADYSEKAAPKRPSSASSYKPRPAQGTPQGVTQAQLEAALARVDGKIKTVADGVSTISSRINSLATAAKKEADVRKKTTDNTAKDLNSKLQMLALLPLLVQPSTAQLNLGASGGTVTVGGVTSTTASVTVADPNPTLDAILPLLLVSGTGSPSSSGGFGLGDGSDGSMLLLALALAFAGKQNP
jgi:hypothetical protein